ncbi:MAG: hypothetical protein HRU46_08670 [Verrucomicrobiales bacterium]|nr:hypothetical protein [Verrucomicrobiales bacterium]
MNRIKLFKLQGWLSILLIAIATLHFSLSAERGDFVKVAIAPFGAISLLLFAFFVFNQRREQLDDDEVYGTRRTLLNLGLAAVTGVIVIFLTTFLGDVTSTLDRIIFSFAIMAASVVFIFEKLRDFRSMAMLTGIGEGITILMIFFR